MFKKKLSAVLAAALVAVMLPATFLAAEEGIEWNNNGGSAEVEGWNNEVTPIIDVELPGDLIFGINPLYLDADEDGDSDAQIVTSQYKIINRGNTDVLVEAVTTADTPDNVENISFLQTNKTDATTGELEATSAARNIYLVQMLPEAPTTISGEEYILNVNEFTLASGADDEIGGLVLGSDAAKVLFRLDAYTISGEDYVMRPANISGFEFAGAVDPNSAFYEGEVTVKTVFTLTTLSENQSTKGYITSDLNGVTYDSTVVEVTPQN